jgi:fructokinase
VEDVAWDWIDIPDELLEKAETASALVFGSLAQREEHNRRQLARLRECCRQGWFVFDVNLRPPFDPAERIWALGQKADLIKLNEAELQQLLGQTLQPDQWAEGTRRMAHQTGCPRICLTAGAAGAGLLINSTWYWSPGRSIRVQDTVGAGDSFLAALTAGLLTGDRSPQQILDQACRLAEFVAGQKGATPAYSVTDQGKILPKQE